MVDPFQRDKVDGDGHWVSLAEGPNAMRDDDAVESFVVDADVRHASGVDAADVREVAIT